MRVLLLRAFGIPLLAQSNTGEIRPKVADPRGLGLKSSVKLVSLANDHYAAIEAARIEQGLLGCFTCASVLALLLALALQLDVEVATVRLAPRVLVSLMVAAGCDGSTPLERLHLNQ